MSHPRRSRAQRIGPVETLEHRLLFAGDVSVFLDRGGNLIVVGDGAANAIKLDHAGEFSIAGVDAGGSPTRVNGEPNGDVRFPVTGEGDVRIYLNGGDDIVEAGTRSDSVDTPDDLEIYMGDGNDLVVSIGDTNIGDDLEIFTGPGDDTVRVISTQIVGDLDVLTDGGDDIVQIYGSEIGDDLLIRTGAGRDSVGVGFVDLFGSRLLGPSSVAEDTLIDLGANDDVLVLIDSDFDGAFRADGGGGRDTLRQTDATFSRRPLFLRFERRGPAM